MNVYLLYVTSVLVLGQDLPYHYNKDQNGWPLPSWTNYNYQPSGPDSNIPPLPPAVYTADGPPSSPGENNIARPTDQPRPPGWLDENLLVYPELSEAELGELNQVEGNHPVSDPRGPIRYQILPLYDINNKNKNSNNNKNNNDNNNNNNNKR